MKILRKNGPGTIIGPGNEQKLLINLLKKLLVALPRIVGDSNQYHPVFWTEIYVSCYFVKSFYAILGVIVIVLLKSFKI